MQRFTDVSKSVKREPINLKDWDVSGKDQPRHPLDLRKQAAQPVRPARNDFFEALPARNTPKNASVTEQTEDTIIIDRNEAKMERLWLVGVVLLALAILGAITWAVITHS